MGKLTDAFNKLEAGRKTFVADMDHWQTETKHYFETVAIFTKKMSELTKLDDAVLNQVKDAKAHSAKALELANARGKKLESISPSGIKASDAQAKAFANCDAFGKLIDGCAEILKAYDTKGKSTKEQKKVDAKKLLVQAKLDLAIVKHSKLNYEYQGTGAAQYSDVVKAAAEIERLKKKFAEMSVKLKADVIGVEETK
jgi:hypothetical protein